MGACTGCAGTGMLLQEKPYRIKSSVLFLLTFGQLIVICDGRF